MLIRPNRLGFSKYAHKNNIYLLSLIAKLVVLYGIDPMTWKLRNVGTYGAGSDVHCKTCSFSCEETLQNDLTGVVVVAYCSTAYAAGGVYMTGCIHDRVYT